MPDVTLGVAIHDPDGRQLPLARAHLARARQAFGQVLALCSHGTRRETVQWLTDAGVVCLDAPHIPDGVADLGRVRRELLRVFVDRQNASHLLYCDFDRVLHWAACYPAELDRLPLEITRYDFLVLGRTPRAFASHPAVQRETEGLANRVFNQVWMPDHGTKGAWDVMAGARGVSRAAAAFLVKHSLEVGLAVDAEWPLLCRLGPARPGPEDAGFTPFQVGYVEVEGLEFETGDRYTAEIAQAGGWDAWIEKVDSDPRGWVLRLEIALGTARAAARWSSNMP